LKVNAITRSNTAPSGWYRIGALTREFDSRGVSINEIVPFISSLPPKNKILRPAWLCLAILERISLIARLNREDVTILQKELISTVPTIERYLPGKVILDTDDAIFMHRRGWAAINAAKASIGVVCGNSYLADFFGQFNKNVRVIPTGVDVNRMKVNPNRLSGSSRKIVGWIGTPENLANFKPILSGLLPLFSEKKMDVEFRVVTSHESAIPFELKPYCTFVKWYPNIEFDELPNWSVGLMPLIDNAWTRGKCAFKFIQYMAAGIPSVVSPVGMNAEILRKSNMGYGAISSSDWHDAITSLIEDDDRNYNYGVQARMIAERDFRLERVVDQWLSVFNDWL
jgi:glycosyltransferase involved in cell wall biosynthesis